MDTIRRRRETGYVTAYPKTGEAGYAIHPDDYGTLRDAWMDGHAFVAVRSFPGNELIIKLATIEAIALHTPETLQAARDEEQADRAEDSIPWSGE